MSRCDEVAHLGYIRILGTTRGARREYDITMVMLLHSIGQMREAFSGRDATSKCFESLSWMSFAAINDPEIADYISKRCGDTHIAVAVVYPIEKGADDAAGKARIILLRLQVEIDGRAAAQSHSPAQPAHYVSLILRGHLPEEGQWCRPCSILLRRRRHEPASVGDMVRRRSRPDAIIDRAGWPIMPTDI